MRLAAKAQFGAKIYRNQSMCCRLAASPRMILRDALDFKAIARRERDFNIFIHNRALVISRAGAARLRAHPSPVWCPLSAAERLPARTVHPA